MNRCSYRYPDDARCVWQGDIAEGEMCREHRTITRRVVNESAKLRRQAMDRSAREAVRKMQREGEIEEAREAGVWAG